MGSSIKKMKSMCVPFRGGSAYIEDLSGLVDSILCNTPSLESLSYKG